MRIPDKVRAFLIVAAGTVALVCLGFVIFSFAAPNVAGQLGLGLSSLSESIRQGNKYGLSPVLDTVLLVGSYTFLSVLLWAVDEARLYIRNRRHFT